MNTDQRSAGRLDASSDLANLRPLHDQVLVKLEEEPEQVGAIYVPKTAQNRGPRTAIVVAVGPGEDMAPGEVVIGAKEWEALEQWVDAALQHYEGAPSPSEIQGKNAYYAALTYAQRKEQAMGVKPGDRVLLGPDPGWELPDGHRMLRIGAVLAVLS